MVAAAVIQPSARSRIGHAPARVAADAADADSSVGAGRMSGSMATATRPPSTARGSAASRPAPAGRNASTAAPVMACARCVVAPAVRASEVRDSEPPTG
jgi:hypothetical protein